MGLVFLALQTEEGLLGMTDRQLLEDGRGKEVEPTESRQKGTSPATPFVP